MANPQAWMMRASEPSTRPASTLFRPKFLRWSHADVEPFSRWQDTRLIAQRKPAEIGLMADKKQGATGITSVAPYVAGQWGRGDNRLEI
jgi:hypothetical protein